MNTIYKTQTKSSYAHDQLSNELVQLCGPVVSRYFSNVFNAIIETETFPEIWNSLNVFPIHKSGCIDGAENHRPISLFSAHNFENLSSEPFGFQAQISCMNAISDLTESIGISLDKKSRKRILCLLDLKKLFDAVNLEIWKHR